MMTDQIDKEVKKVEMWDRHIVMTGQVDKKVTRVLYGIDTYDNRSS